MDRSLPLFISLTFHICSYNFKNAWAIGIRRLIVENDISSSIVAAFLGDSVKRFNANSVMVINHDLQTLENFADERFHSTGLSEVYMEGSFRSCLKEVGQLINLLSSSQSENFADLLIREQCYNGSDRKKVASISEKFKDSTDEIFGSLSTRNAKTSSRKKSIDMLKKRLKDFN